MTMNDKIKQIKEETGTISFGTKIFDNNVINDKCSVMMVNKGVVAKKVYH
ncbi:hypothetical protein HPK19_11790 [Arthrobacter citreus]|nr:hypothetical protein HPK19_11790 [Arthrobacter citreus]